MGEVAGRPDAMAGTGWENISRTVSGMGGGDWRPCSIEPTNKSPGVIQGAATMELTSDQRFYFLGIDPAPAQGKKSDDGGMGALRVRPKPGVTNPTSNLSDWLVEYVWAYRVRGADIRQWSGFIHLKHRHFGFAGMLMDPGAGGGGGYLELELAKGRQLINGIETDVTPIASMEQLASAGGMAQHILVMFRRRDPGIQSLWPHLAGDDSLAEAMHVVFQEAVSYMIASFPKPYNQRPKAETETWSEEKKWALRTLDAAREQMMDIQVATKEDGTWAVTRNGAKTFSAHGKKDLAYACIFAYVRFLIWLRMGELDFMRGSQESGGCHVF